MRRRFYYPDDYDLDRPPPRWYFEMMEEGRSRRNKSRGGGRRGEMNDFLETMMAWDYYQDAKEKRRKEAEEKNKKPEKQSQFMTAVQWAGTLTVLGIPVGFAVLGLLSLFVMVASNGLTKAVTALAK